MDTLYTIIIYPITQIIEFVFVFTRKIFKETGVSIIAISVVISILCLPLYLVAEKWQQIERDIQKKLAPKIAKIKAVFSGDEQYMMLSTYYRQNHYHPVYAMRSTFGLLIQIPFFIAAYSYLSHPEALQGASFLFISDMGKPDALIPGGYNLLPIIMTAINCIAGAIYSKDLPAKDKIQLYGMAGIFLVLLYNSPAGLVLYWTMNNIFSLAKNIYHAIKFKHKNAVIFAALSGLCIFLICYLLLIHRGNINLRILLSVLFGIIGIVPWIFPRIKKLFSNRPSAWHSERELFPIFVFSSLALWVLVGLVVPSLLIVSSPQEFSFIDIYTTPLAFIAITASQAFGLLVFWPFCLYMLFSFKTKKVGTMLYFFALLCAICNVFLFPGNYGLISITLEFTKSVGDGSKNILINFFVLLVPIAAGLFFFLKKSKQILVAIPVLCIFSFSGIFIRNAHVIQGSYAELAKFYNPEEGQAQTVEPIFHLSKTGKNVIVIMLDRAINVFVPYIFDEMPELKSVYSGFTYYPNTVSFNGYTGIGAPPIFGGYESTPIEINRRIDVPLRRKHNEALLMMPRIFSEAGYSVAATDSPYANYSDKPDMRIYDEIPGVKAYITDSVYTDIWVKEHEFNLPQVSGILRRGILWYSIFRVAPLAFREGIYMRGDWNAPIANRSLRLTLNGYSVLDYLPQLTDGESLTENTALLITNNTTHEGSLLQAPDYVPATAVTNYGTSPFRKESAYHINAASIKRLADWFLYLKDNGLYDNSRIILVSDHGPERNFITKIGLPFNVDQFNPLLMVKDFNASDLLQTDMSFMSNADVPVFALKGLIDNPVNPFTGNRITDENKQKPLYIAISGSIHLSDPDVTQFALDPKEDYYVRDSIFDPNGWERAEK